MLPETIPNIINGKEILSRNGQTIEKLNPATGKLLCCLTRSASEDINEAVVSAKNAFTSWSETPPVKRGEILHNIVILMKKYQKEIAEIVSLETGKSFNDAFGETSGAISLGLFYASEGQRLYGKTTTSGTANKYAMTIRCPIGVAALIIAANTPIANAAWKVFPALVCGNAAILKASEDTPATAWIFGKIAHEAGLPAGVLNIIQGLGNEAGDALVRNPNVGVISFTGSTKIGIQIQQISTDRLARVSLELGGKNALVVCDDADLENAVKWTLLSAFSNAGQRCAACSRIIVFDKIYDEFKTMLLSRIEKLKVGTSNTDDLGPVINEKQLNNMLCSIKQASERGVEILCGGSRLTGEKYDGGFYMTPTILENANPNDEISTKELFGPIANLYRAIDFNDALALVNNSPYGLTTCIHTKNYHRAVAFYQKAYTGVVVVNAGTYGSEPHMPFGGTKMSGNGTREPGTEAIDVYTELKDVYINIDPSQL